MRISVYVVLLAVVFLNACMEPDEPRKPVAAAATILVTGATGTQGGAVARALLQRGYSVRALTRNPQKPSALALKAIGATLVQGDFADVDSLVTAMQGAHGVFAMTDFWQHSYDVEIQHGRNLVDAAQAAGVAHFVFTSVANADHTTGIPHFDSKYEIETYIRASGIPYSIVRPVSFMNNWLYDRESLLEGRYRSPLRPERSNQYIAASDIGYFVAEAFDSPAEWLGRAVDIAGDELTGTDLIALFSSVLGREVSYEQIPWQEYEATAGPEMTIMDRWLDETGYDVDIQALRMRHPAMMDAKSFVNAAPWVSGE